MNKNFILLFFEKQKIFFFNYVVFWKNDEFSCKLRSRQIDAVLQLTPLAVIINLVNVIAAAASLYNQISIPSIGLWSFFVITLNIASYKSWYKWKKNRVARSVSARTGKISVVHAGVLGIVWGALPLFFFCKIDNVAQFYIATMIIGMICAGGFALTSLPMAATAYVLSLTICFVIGIARSNFFTAKEYNFLVIIYGITVIYSVWKHGISFACRIIAESEAVNQKNIIFHLLKDFENDAKDLFWELDASGKLTHFSPKLAEIFSLSPEILKGKNVYKLLRRYTKITDEAKSWPDEIKNKIQFEAVVRDFQITNNIVNNYRWLSLSWHRVENSLNGCGGWRGVINNITEKKQAYDQLTYLANNDNLTGLLNRSAFQKKIEKKICECVCNEQFAILCIDVDNFKHINDTFGHNGGDLALIKISSALSHIFHSTLIAARVGGDEFAVLIEIKDFPDSIFEITEKLFSILRGKNELQHDSFSIQISAGAAIFPDHGMDYNVLFNKADLAMYSAKKNGGGKVFIFEEKLAEQFYRKSIIEKELKFAVLKNELTVLYQPIKCNSNGNIVGVEALLRWSHPKFGDISPVEFIPIAENTGDIIEIGNWVFREACRQAKLWPAYLTVSVNVSPIQLNDPSFIVLITDAAKFISPCRICLEITESVVLADSVHMMTVCSVIRNAGFGLALDDFGTGYSALSYLTRFPFTAIKIDKSFVQSMEDLPNSLIVIDTIVGLAKSLGMLTIAEGVENEEQDNMLRLHGCWAHQGYLIGRPVSPSIIDSIIEKNGFVVEPIEHSTLSSLTKLAHVVS